MSKITYTLATPGREMGQGDAVTVGGVRLVARKTDGGWQVDEPLTGRAVSRDGATKKAAVVAAEARIALFGGPLAVFSSMADCKPAPHSRHVHAAEMAYGAGGPLDAPNDIPTGCTRFSPYAPPPASAYQVTTPRGL
jgi:hypothetical protein